jgi:hypothetical protein
MTAHDVDKAGEQLESMRHRRRDRLLLGIAVAGLAGATFLYSGTMALALLAGVGCSMSLVLVDTIRRRELLAGLALNRNAYALPEVRRYGAKLVMAGGLSRLANALERVLTNAGTPGAYYLTDRVDKFRDDIDELAEALREPGARVEPTSVARCWRLLTRAAESPLYNGHIPEDDLGFEVQRIRAGIQLT